MNVNVLHAKKYAKCFVLNVQLFNQVPKSERHNVISIVSPAPIKRLVFREYFYYHEELMQISCIDFIWKKWMAPKNNENTFDFLAKTKLNITLI